MYRCSTCHRPIGVFLGSNGKPELFKCPYSGRVSHTIPELPIVRKAPKVRKDIAGEDLSARATKRKREEHAQG